MLTPKQLQHLGQLEEKLGVEFRNKLLLQSAITHRSYLNEHCDAFWDHNERLEFLGDAIIDMCVTEFLFDRFSELTEGELTERRAALVNSQALAIVGEPLGLPDILCLSNGEARLGLKDPKTRKYMAACGVEAIVGAVHKDQGIGMSRMVVDLLILRREGELFALYADPKSKLLALVQRRHGVTPDYKVLSETGPDHDKCFRVAVSMGNIQIGIGMGRSTKEAQVAAATDALAHIPPEVSHARQ